MLVARLSLSASFVFSFVVGEFYAGMFAKDDFLVANDFIHKERIPYQTTTAKYGRVFKCPITYMRVVDRVMGTGDGAVTDVVRGGLLQYFVVMRIVSANDMPVSSRVLVGCHNPNKTAPALLRLGLDQDYDDDQV